MRMILRAASAAALIAGLCVAAQADEVEDALKMALEAYQAGDINAAKEEIDYAAQLVSQMKAAGLSGFLPDAQPGWTRDEDGSETQGNMGFGGGMAASAKYTRDNDRIEIQLMADNQMVTAMAGMFNNAAMMGSLGQVKRIQRQKVVITKQGDLQAMISNRILVQITGRAPVEDKEAYFEALDLRGLQDF
ncbi:MAG TPA: hypothetical protein VMY41_03610 [Thermohalobaculum sp.]|nr:hypothetical protein [Thermohalobaculum sp.]